MPANKRKEYILAHLGLMTYEDIQTHLDISETTLYNDLKSIRSERDLIHKDAISTVAEEQFNRLNTSAKLAFKDLIAHKKKIQELEKIDLRLLARSEQEQINGQLIVLYKMTYTINKTHQVAERSLTKFLQAVGAFRQEVGVDMSQTIIVQSDIPDIETLRRSEAVDIVAMDVPSTKDSVKKPGKKSGKKPGKGSGKKKGRPIGDLIVVEE